MLRRLAASETDATAKRFWSHDPTSAWPRTETSSARTDRHPIYKSHRARRVAPSAASVHRAIRRVCEPHARSARSFRCSTHHAQERAHLVRPAPPIHFDFCERRLVNRYDPNAAAGDTVAQDGHFPPPMAWPQTSLIDCSSSRARLAAPPARRGHRRRRPTLRGPPKQAATRARTRVKDAKVGARAAPTAVGEHAGVGRRPGRGFTAFRRALGIAATTHHEFRSP